MMYFKKTIVIFLLIPAFFTGCGSPFMRNILGYTAANPGASGANGSQKNPFLVENEDDLRHVGRPESGHAKYARWGLDKFYQQKGNISLSSPDWEYGTVDWVPIGTELKPFSGSYDGENYTITGIKNSNTGAFYQGMFGHINEKGHVINVRLINISLTGIGIIGGIAGKNCGTVANCSSAGSISTNNSMSECVGGVVGDNSGAKALISNSESGCTVRNVYGINTGGIAGRNNDGTIRGCNASGIIEGKEYIGGVTGYNFGMVAHCAFVGTISGKINAGSVAGINDQGTVSYCSSLGDISGEEQIGGIVGDNYNYATVEYCFSAVNVFGYNDIGGVAGTNYGEINCCFATGPVKGNNYGTNTGGVAGLNESSGLIKNSYSTGTVDNISTEVGGVAGYNMGIIECCFATGEVSAKSNGGGIAGKNVGNVESCVALNSVMYSFETDLQRVAGHSEGFLFNNYGWDSMPGNAWIGYVGGTDGADVFATDDPANGYYSLIFWESGLGWSFSDTAWSWEPGCLPYLLNETPNMPDHLKAP